MDLLCESRFKIAMIGFMYFLGIVVAMLVVP